MFEFDAAGYPTPRPFVEGESVWSHGAKGLISKCEDRRYTVVTATATLSDLTEEDITHDVSSKGWSIFSPMEGWLYRDGTFRFTFAKATGIQEGLKKPAKVIWVGKEGRPDEYPPGTYVSYPTGDIHMVREDRHVVVVTQAGVLYDKSVMNRFEPAEMVADGLVYDFNGYGVTVLSWGRVKGTALVERICDKVTFDVRPTDLKLPDNTNLSTEQPPPPEEIPLVPGQVRELEGLGEFTLLSTNYSGGWFVRFSNTREKKRLGHSSIVTSKYVSGKKEPQTDNEAFEHTIQNAIDNPPVGAMRERWMRSILSNVDRLAAERVKRDFHTANGIVSRRLALFEEFGNDGLMASPDTKYGKDKKLIRTS